MRPVGVFLFWSVCVWETEREKGGAPLCVRATVRVWKEERERESELTVCVCACVCVCASEWVCEWLYVCGSKLLAVKVKYRRGREKDETHPKQSKIYKVYKYYGNPNEWSNEKD